MMKQMHVNECDSTQDILKEQMARAPSNDTILVSCENQLNGRGRGENSWIAMPGTLCFSFNLSPSVVISFTALEISLLIVRFFEARGAQLSLKWPNDIWDREGKKCAGILVQTQQSHYLAGVGLNLFGDQIEFGYVFSSAQSLRKEDLSAEMVDYLLSHRYQDVNHLRKDWEARCAHMNREVSITENHERVVGIFQGLGSHGEAVIKTSSGARHMYNGSLRLT